MTRWIAALRRPRTALTLALGALVVLIAAALLVPPLGRGSAGVTSGPPNGRTEGGPDGAAVIFYLPGGKVGIGIEVRNSTFLPVTITGLTGGTAVFALEDVGLVLAVDAGYVGLEEDHVRPFEPLTLAPGQAQLIGLVGAFPACTSARPNWSTGVGRVFRALRLDTRVAGLLPVVAEVPLFQPVELRGDADAACK